MTNGHRIKIRGHSLARLRNKLALTQRELGEKAGVGETRIRHIERAEEVGVYAPTFRKIAEAALMTIEQLRAAIGVEAVEEQQKAFELGMKTSREIQQKARGEFDRSIEPYSEVKVADVPLFEASLAAGPWVDVSDIGEVCDPAAKDHGLFRVRLAGDSMQPAYRDGSIVEFRCLRIDRDGVIEGKDYYVQKDDGTATFKRVAKVNEETFELRAINKKKYPKPMMVERAVVVRMALAMWKLEAAE